MLLALTLVGLLLPLAPRAQGETEFSLNFFYDNLSPYGSWLEVSDYGYVFQPSVAVNNSSWRPYADGYWAYTDLGWTWVSYEDFGWATYHYGRWTELTDYGWVWVPGYEWGPAWVSWRTGGDYIGWAPLPPAAPRVYEGRVISGQVDIQFDIGPLCYNFVDIRYIGEPVLRERIFEPQRNVTIINQTVNVTNITYNNSTVYNYGPDFNRVNEFSTRPVQRLSIQRETTVSADLQSKRGNFNRVNGNQLVVVAPPVQKSEQKIAPKQVKAKVEKANIEHGWQGVQNRQQLQEAMKKENAKNVPPPSFKPERARKAEAATAGEEKAGQSNATAKTSPGPGNERQAERAARRAEREQNAQQAEKTGNAQEANQQQAQQTAREQKARQAAQRRAEQEQRMKEQQQANQGEKPGKQRGQDAQGTEAENNRKAQEPNQPDRQEARLQTEDQANQRARAERSRAQQAESQQNERDRQQAEQAQQQRQQEREPSQRADRAQHREHAQQMQQAQERERVPQPSREGMASRGQQAGPHRERVQQPQQAQQGRPQGQAQHQGDQNDERKGKKKHPNEEPSPRP